MKPKPTIRTVDQLMDAAAADAAAYEPRLKVAWAATAAAAKAATAYAAARAAADAAAAAADVVIR